MSIELWSPSISIRARRVISVPWSSLKHDCEQPTISKEGRWYWSLITTTFSMTLIREIKLQTRQQLAVPVWQWQLFKGHWSFAHCMEVYREPSSMGCRWYYQGAQSGRTEVWFTVVGQTSFWVSVWFIGPKSIRTVGTDHVLAPSVAFTFTARPAVILSILWKVRLELLAPGMACVWWGTWAFLINQPDSSLVFDLGGITAGENMELLASVAVVACNWGGTCAIVGI